MFVPRSVKRKKETRDSPYASSTDGRRAPNAPTAAHVTQPSSDNVIGNVLNDIVNRTIVNLAAMQAGQQAAMVPAATGLHQPLHTSSSHPAWGQSISVAQLFTAARNQARNQVNASMMNVGALCSSGTVPVYNRSGTNRPGTSRIQPDRCFDNVGWVPGEQTRREKGSDVAHHIGRFCPPRQWEWTEAGRLYERRPTQHRGFDVTVMSYNVLSQDLLEDNMRLYNHCSRNVLSWRHRRERLLQEIKHLNPDILCLQEVNTQHYDEFFKPKLHRMGYASDFVKRTGNKLDGCATFYKTVKFSLEESKKVPYYHPKGSDVLDRDNVALIVKLRPRSNRVHASRRLCVSNTHLLFNPRRGDVKLAQLMVLLAELDKIAYIQDSGESEQSYHGIVMCGDFNSEPHSDMYKLLTMGHLEYEGLAIRDISGQHDLRPGRETFLTRDFFPHQVGINDNCQYCDAVRNRKTAVTGKAATSSSRDSCGRKMTSREYNTDKSSSSSSDASGAKMTSREHKNSKKGNDDDDDNDVKITSLQSTGVLQHQLRLVSAYGHTLSRLRDNHDEVTTHHGRASCTVDYIFYGVKSGLVKFADGKVKFKNVQEGHMSLLGRYGLMADYELRSMGSLPNMHLGSDHLSIMAKFLLG